MKEPKLIRVKDIVGDRKHGIVGLIPVSESTLYRWISAGDFPPPYIRRGRWTAWLYEDIEKWIAQGGKCRDCAAD